jgi:hypothetical protein
MRKARSRKPRDGDRKSDAHNEIAHTAASAAQEAASAEREAAQSADEAAEAEMIEIPDGAYVHIFNSVSEDDLHGLTLKRTGDNLPVEKGPWTHFTDILINEGQFVPRVGVEDEDFEKKALTAIRIHGFYLIKARIILPLNRHQ